MSKYLELKKQGKFYVAEYESAYILWYLLGYKVMNSKVSFPVESLSKVLNVLEEHHVYYRIPIEVGKVEVHKGVNLYDEVLEKAKKKWLKEKQEKEILEKIKKARKEDLLKILDYMERVL